MTRPKYEFRISAMGPAKIIDAYWLTPASAAQRDPDAFLLFAAQVAKTADKLRAHRAQQRMNL